MSCDGSTATPETRVERYREGEDDMAGGKTDELKGRVKEAAGALTGDEKLKREGQVDQAVGKIKQKTDEIIDKVKEAVK